ncbi:DUF3515 domain-containing protein [Microbispora amethystogenes]|uniref:DUF3515 domain-containing protein n=2 Tax=Microbispora TaxID=2005 RepID=A0A5J5JZN6_9ACTN|nr:MULTISPECIES: DUF3515 domain-containing protein [Microbispora]KAA9377099.1 DUF3515 domain-containing protein [Microbispora cellulosiformans]GIH33857.1 hypothetical protein Mam01_40210 [Microbispora amethystogenes]
MRVARGTAATAAGVTLALLTACSSTVHVEPPAPAGEAAAACRRLGPALPGTLDGLGRAESEPPSPYVAVWGDGQIALRCGVPRPAEMEPTAEVVDVNGVGWFQDPRLPTLFTSVNRVAYVEVTIAKSHQPAAVLVDLAEPVKRNVPE